MFILLNTTLINATTIRAIVLDKSYGSITVHFIPPALTSWTTAYDNSEEAELDFNKAMGVLCNK